MNKLIGLCSVAALAAGLAFAQPPPGEGRRAGARHGQHRAIRQLDLTENQKAQAKDIFQAARAEAQPLRQQMRDARQRLAADVKAGAAEGVISQDANVIGNLTAQLTVMRARTHQKFLSILTPEQKAKLDTLRQDRRFGRGARRG